MSGKLTLLSEQLPPKNSVLITVSHGPMLHEATFDGFRFIDRKTGNEFALGCIVAWYDMSQHEKSEWSSVAGGLHIYVNALYSALSNTQHSQKI